MQRSCQLLRKHPSPTASILQHAIKIVLLPPTCALRLRCPDTTSHHATPHHTATAHLRTASAVPWYQASLDSRPGRWLAASVSTKPEPWPTKVTLFRNWYARDRWRLRLRSKESSSKAAAAAAGATAAYGCLIDGKCGSQCWCRYLKSRGSCSTAELSAGPF
jgi:hypothetical protein